MDYIIHSANNKADLCAAVRESIAEGWELQGGVSLAVYFDNEPGYYVPHEIYCQAMIRRDDTKPSSDG